MQKLILISDSCLVRSILKRAFRLNHEFQVVAEVADLAGFNSVLDDAEADWMLLAQPLQERIPEKINQALRDCPELRLLVVATNSNRVQICGQGKEFPNERAPLPGQWATGRGARFWPIDDGAPDWEELLSTSDLLQTGITSGDFS